MSFFSNVFKSVSKGSKSKTIQKGFGKVELQQFMKDAGNLGSATTRVDTTQEGFGPQFSSKVVSKSSFDAANALNNTDGSFEERRFNAGANALTEEFSKDQVKGFIEAFGRRQDEVFQRRAQPGIQQTRLV